MFVRVVAGAVIALVVVALARRVRALSASGVVAAFAVGALAISAGWSWGALLVAYFVSSSVLSRYGAATKDARTAAIVAKGGERDAVQVLANGLGFAVAAALSLAPTMADAESWIRVAALGAGALAASASDTWATEIGTLASAQPRSILTLRPVPPGSSGGVTVVGLAAAVAGAAFVGIVAAAVGWPARLAVAACVGGVAGSTIDSILGATVQARRYCTRCDHATEREIHDCGMQTRASGGIRWLGNDAVNFVSTIAGGLLAMLMAR